MENNNSRRSGKIISYNGTYGFIASDNGSIYFHQNSLRCSNDLCKNDIVKYSVRPSRKRKGENEAFNVDIIQYGNFRGKFNNVLRLGNPEVEIGLIKWFDKEKGYGVVVNCDNEESFMRDKSYLSFSLTPGSVVIYSSFGSGRKKQVKLYRLPQLLEDWEFIKDIPEDASNFIIDTYCKVNPYEYGGMGHQDITYNIKTQAAQAILQKKNIQFFKGMDILSNLIKYYATHSVGMFFNLEDYRHLFTSKEDFDLLCRDLFLIIKNYQGFIGVDQLFDFVFKYKYISFDSLDINEKKELINTFINFRLKTKKHPNKPEYQITYNVYGQLLKLIDNIKEDDEIYRNFCDETVSLYDIETLILLLFVDNVPIASDKSSFQDLFYSKLLYSLGITKKSQFDSSLSVSNYSANGYGCSLQKPIFQKHYDIPKSCKDKISNYQTYFDLVKWTCASDKFSEESKHSLITIIYKCSGSTSKKMILEDADIFEYLYPATLQDIDILRDLKMLGPARLVNRIIENYENNTDEQNYRLWKAGLITLDERIVLLAARNIDINCLLDTCKLLKNKDEISYLSAFAEIYDSLTGEERLYLWLNDLSDRYDYVEFLQYARVLSVTDRKILNKKIKAHAKQERFISFLNQIPEAEIIEKSGSKIVYRCRWRNLYYKNSEIIVFLNKEFAMPAYHWDSAREEWNWLTNEYFNRKRIGEIYVHTDNNVVTDIIGLDNIEERIIVADIQHNGTMAHRLKINQDQMVRILHNVAARNKCIDFLSRQKSPYDAIDIQELVSNQYGEIRRDISFMFIIPDGSFAYIVWESVEYEKSKATYIFRCEKETAALTMDNIKKYIESNLHIRSRLIAPALTDNIRNELKFYARVNHDSEKYEIWEARIKEALPFLN